VALDSSMDGGAVGPSGGTPWPAGRVHWSNGSHAMVHSLAQFLYQNEEGIEGKLTLGSSTSLDGRVRLAAVAPVLQALEMVCGSSKASLAPKIDERQLWMSSPQCKLQSARTHRNHEFKFRLGF
jgi:hypothetical protein